MEGGFYKVPKRSKIIIQKRLGDIEMEQIKKHKDCTEIALWNTKHKDLQFLEILSKLISVEFYSIQVDDFDALTKIYTLERVFLNGIKNHGNLSFINQLENIRELDLLYLPKLEKFPDLSNCKKLTRIRIWNCKRLTNIENLSLIPNLEEFAILETPQNPENLEFLIKLDNIKYVSAQFGTNKLNKQFEDLLAAYEKIRHRPQ